MNSAEDQATRLAVLLQLSRRVRTAAGAEEIAFIAVNETKQLVAYRQSALWLATGGVVAVSGVPEPDRDAPYVQWLESCFKQLKQTQPAILEPGELPEPLAKTWSDWLPAGAAVIPLGDAQGQVVGRLLFARDDEWHDQELALLAEVGSIYGHGLGAAAKQGGFLPRKGAAAANWLRVLAPMLAIAALFIPVRMSVQAPAEVVPKDPFVVRSPLEAVIDRFHVKPNQPVSEGQLLFEFDRTSLAARHGVASKAFEVAAEEYRQSAQSALLDDKNRLEVVPRRGRMQEKATELHYTRQMLNRVEVRAPRSGIAVFAEQGDWIGKNVAAGERVITIADPARVEILVRLPVADALELKPGDPLRLYLTTDPQKQLQGSLRYIAYRPETSAAGIAAYRIKADLAPTEQPPRIGLTGTARIYGKNVSLGYYIFRKPLTALRQKLGW